MRHSFQNKEFINYVENLSKKKNGFNKPEGGKQEGAEGAPMHWPGDKECLLGLLANRCLFRFYKIFNRCDRKVKLIFPGLNWLCS